MASLFYSLSHLHARFLHRNDWNFIRIQTQIYKAKLSHAYSPGKAPLPISVDVHGLSINQHMRPLALLPRSLASVCVCGGGSQEESGSQREKGTGVTLCLAHPWHHPAIATATLTDRQTQRGSFHPLDGNVTSQRIRASAYGDTAQLLSAICRELHGLDGELFASINKHPSRAPSTEDLGDCCHVQYPIAVYLCVCTCRLLFSAGGSLLLVGRRNVINIIYINNSHRSRFFVSTTKSYFFGFGCENSPPLGFGSRISYVYLNI